MTELNERRRELFEDEDAALQFVEKRLWPEGPVCPHCGHSGPIHAIEMTCRVRKGLNQCGACRKTFTVRYGTFFQRSRMPMNKWLHAIWLVCEQPDISARQVGLIAGLGRNNVLEVVKRIHRARSRGELAPLGYAPLDGG